MPRAFFLALLLALPACGSLALRHAWLSDQLYFGLNSPHGRISEAAWREFLDTVVTPRFPDGLSAWDAQGQWKDSKGQIEKEGSKVLQLVHPPSAAAEQSISEIIQAYKIRFKQESVLRLSQAADAKF